MGHFIAGCRVLFGIAGVTTMVVGVTAPTDSTWIKVVGVLCGLVVALMAATFTTLVTHLVNHGKDRDKDRDRFEDLVDDRIERRAEICGLEEQNMKEKVDKIYRKICGKKERINNGRG